ncbi:hypothetical protein HPB48_011107 [Haemaphysalis longicornis]|uniref:Uncharacterized protein n=1 Tax=Haemaphysalis longicornis TaxID=44386 RepID=A0A9J6FY25_HAELO|nr:hypothetical protein HPB48_011107 [Haemaphysalis longicornis]
MKLLCRNKAFIWPCIAPVLSTLLLPKCDRSIETRIDTANIENVFSYVDDHLFITRTFKSEEGGLLVKVVEETFVECSDGLKFTHELPTEGAWQFLYVCSSFRVEQVCWRMGRGKKKKRQFRITVPRISR